VRESRTLGFSKTTDRFEIRDTFARGPTRLRTYKTLLLEDERGSNEDTADDGQDDADDFETRIGRGGVSGRGHWDEG